MTNANANMEAQLERLVSHPSYARLMEIQPPFDLFDVLGTLLENASSRALAFLLDSTAEHGLGTSFLDKLLWEVYLESRAGPERLGLREVLQLRGSETSVTTEWRTGHGRRLDILVRVLGNDRKLKGMLGIENKHWAPEQPDQVRDYQTELAEVFGAYSTPVLLFLTPDAHSPTTGNVDSECRCVPCSYKSVVVALHRVEETLEGEIRLLVSSLARHFDKSLEGSFDMTSEIRELIDRLYCDEGHRRAMRYIVDNLPTFGAVARGVVTKVQTRFRDPHGEEIFDAAMYPSTPSDKIREIGFRLRDLNRLAEQHGFLFSYVLHLDYENTHHSIADIGDSVKVQLMALCNDDDAKRYVDSLGLREQLRKELEELGKPHSWWHKWCPVWAGGEHTLVDLREKDVQACSSLVIDAIEKTLEPLRRVATAQLSKGK